jgi:hypothetical protein
MSGVPSHIRSGRRWSPSVAVVALLALVLAACGSGGSASEASSGSDTTLFGSESSQGTTGQDGSDATTAPDHASAEATTPSSVTDQDLPNAPDFTLELGEGGEFALAAEPRPVYLIFWAEW